ncbi:hypothetical protein S7335_875 [Synechococcus sp. PCC 7335]|uniref:toll/interleukin-1 receptor domain-containing protein n=1 Tax=Synechococcus sp. (strain ATCC 29403 / PCC 7335) TaxID=91464 RepID=UPI00017EBCF0|nr:toll/interleukin-1 receptor domain-containing protein [Synechococcus sp. PCC 7335]EDX82427.1 hypothetical protein S7335_875 [Synechococcus sp. PCC 7335]
MHEFDVFISHASEDKAKVARPLTEALTRAGLRVWLDELEIQIGDSLREKIDYGLSRSRFGVVILSPNFFEKQWPERELNGLFAIEEDGEKRILPVWHEVDKRVVRSHSPMLANRLAAQTSSGLKSVTSAITTVIQKDGVTSTLFNIIEAGPSVEALASFLKTYPRILEDCVGHYGVGHPEFLDQIVPPFDLSFNLFSLAFRATNGRFDWKGFLFLPADPKDKDNESVVHTLDLCRKALQKANTSTYTHRVVQDLLSGNSFSDILLNSFLNKRRDAFSGAVFYGRSGQLSERQREIVNEIERASRFLKFYSYDRLLDVSVKSQ